MSESAFSQPAAVHALVIALGKMQDLPEITPKTLAAAVAAQFPDVPIAALAVVASGVLRLCFGPVEQKEIEHAGLSIREKIAALEFFAGVHRHEAAALKAMLAIRTAAGKP